MPEKWYNILHRYGGKETRRRQNEVFGCIPHGRGALTGFVHGVKWLLWLMDVAGEGMGMTMGLEIFVDVFDIRSMLKFN